MRKFYFSLCILIFTSPLFAAEMKGPAAMPMKAPAIDVPKTLINVPPPPISGADVKPNSKTYGFGGGSAVPTPPKAKDPTKPVRGGPTGMDIPKTIPKINLPVADVMTDNPAESSSGQSAQGAEKQNSEKSAPAAMGGMPAMPSGMPKMSAPKMPTPAQMKAAAPSLQVPSSPFETPKPQRSGIFGGGAKPVSPSPIAPPQAEEKDEPIFTPLSIILLTALVAAVFFFGKKRG